MQIGIGPQDKSAAMSTLNLAVTPLQDLNGDEEPFVSRRSGFIAASPTMRKLLNQVNIIAPHLRIATIEGESGVGKHTLARLLYESYSSRHPAIRRRGFTRFNAHEWLLAQTFPSGHEGFIFLDRVDSLNTKGHESLLRILRDLEFSPPGALVLVFSSESCLRELARNGRFPGELGFRLASVRLTIPPLRERGEDILPLASHFLKQFSVRFCLPQPRLTPDATERLLQYRWPGNLTELSGVLESAFLECVNGVIRSEDLPLPHPGTVFDSPSIRPSALKLDDVIHEHILRVLELNQGNKLRTARQLGISRSTLFRLLDKRLTFSA